MPQVAEMDEEIQSRPLFFRRGNLKAACARVEQEVPLTPEVAHLLEFIRAAKRGVAMGPKDARDADSE